MAQSILTNTTIATGGRILNLFLGVLVTALITRLLGPDQFGAYILLLSVGAIVQLAADFGLYLSLTKTVARHPDRAGVILSQFFSLRLFLLVVVFILAAFGTLFIPALRELTFAFVIMSLGLSCQSFSQLFMGIYQHRQTVWRATLGDLVGRLAQIAGIVIAGIYLAHVNTMMAAFTIGAALAYLVHHWLLPATPWRLVFAWPAWKKIIAVSWPLGAMLLVNAFYFRLDMLILSFFRPPGEIGWYGAAYRVVESALFFPAMFGGLLLPRLTAALSRRATAVVNQYLAEGTRLLLVLTPYCLITLLYFSSTIILLIAGQAFAPAAPLLRILSLALVIMFFGNLYGFTLVALGRQTLLLKLYLALAFFNTLANLMLVPRYGAAAAAWTTVATELIAAGSAAFFVHQATGFKLSAALIIKVTLIGLGGSVVLLALPPAIPVLVKLLLITIIYGLAVLGAKLVSPAHFRLLRAAAVDHDSSFIG